MEVRPTRGVFNSRYSNAKAFPISPPKLTVPHPNYTIIRYWSTGYEAVGLKRNWPVTLPLRLSSGSQHCPGEASPVLIMRHTHCRVPLHTLDYSSICHSTAGYEHLCIVGNNDVLLRVSSSSQHHHGEASSNWTPTAHLMIETEWQRMRINAATAGWSSTFDTVWTSTAGIYIYSTKIPITIQ
jgi:hypothetical protein